MKNVQRIIIVGHPGAGKAVLAEAIANKTHWDFVDADYGLEYTIGLPITDIIGEQGNTALRHCENNMLKQYRDRGNVIIGTDAGIVFSEANRALLKSEYVVFVNVSLAVQLERFTRGKAHLMLNANREALLRKIHERDNLFSEVANITVNTDNGDVDAHVNAILADANITAPEIEQGNVKLDNSDLIQLHNITYASIHLTEQQAICLKLLAYGKSAKEIAKDLDISYRTVEGHIAKLQELLGCTSSRELISLYLMGRP